MQFLISKYLFIKINSILSILSENCSLGRFICDTYLYIFEISVITLFYVSPGNSVKYQFNEVISNWVGDAYGILTAAGDVNKLRQRQLMFAHDNNSNN